MTAAASITVARVDYTSILISNDTMAMISVLVTLALLWFLACLHTNQHNGMVGSEALIE